MGLFFYLIIVVVTSYIFIKLSTSFLQKDHEALWFNTLFPVGLQLQVEQLMLQILLRLLFKMKKKRLLQCFNLRI